MLSSSSSRSVRASKKVGNGCPPMLEVHGDGGKVLVEAADDVENKRAINAKSLRASAMDLNLRQ